MGYLAQFLGRFSESFAAAVALWPLASLLLTLPILAYLYHRDGRLRAASAVSAYLAVLYVLGLGCFTLYPLPDGTSGPGITYGIEPRFNPLGFLDDLAKDGVRALPDMVANVAFFVPLGFIAGRLLRWRFAMTLAAGFGTSLLIETAQLTGLFGLYPYAYRMFDVLDLFCNTAGAAVGWGAAVLAGRLLPPGELAREGRVTDRPGFVRRAVAFWIDLFVMGVVWSSCLPWRVSCCMRRAIPRGPTAAGGSARLRLWCSSRSRALSRGFGRAARSAAASCA